MQRLMAPLGRPALTTANRFSASQWRGRVEQRWRGGVTGQGKGQIGPARVAGMAAAVATAISYP